MRPIEGYAFGEVISNDRVVQIVRAKKGEELERIAKIYKEKGDEWKKELCVVNTIRHPNFISLFELIQTRCKIGLVYQKWTCSLNDLNCGMMLLRPDGLFFSELEIISITKVICEAAKELHTHGIIHNNINSDNILIDECGQIKLSDFAKTNQFPDCILTSDVTWGDVVAIGKLINQMRLTRQRELHSDLPSLPDSQDFTQFVRLFDSDSRDMSLNDLLKWDIFRQTMSRDEVNQCLYQKMLITGFISNNL